MASSLTNTTVDAVKRRPLTRSKHVKDILPRCDARRTVGNISKLSPEAQIAMKMAQDDTKENMSFTRSVKTDLRSTQDGSKNNFRNNKFGEHTITIPGSVNDFKSNSRAPLIRSTGTRFREASRTRKNTESCFGASVLNSTARSRSTLSLNDRNFSISDNTESCYNCSNSNLVKQGNTATSNLSNKDNDCENINNTNSNKTQQGEKQLQNCEDVYLKHNDENINKEEIMQGNEQITQPKSFVLALDQVLEQNFLSRLKGDITNTSRISEPGKVRALDGGRLTNAQEVVVNVCHDDDRELVFHDDDEESLNNAKTISEIRINMWLKYNEGFHPDDTTDDISIGSKIDDNGNNTETNGITLPSESRNKNQAPRERTVNKPRSERSHAIPRSNNRSKWQPVKTDANNNNIPTGKSKSGHSNNLKNISSTKIGSRIGVSSIKKDRKM